MQKCGEKNDNKEENMDDDNDRSSHTHKKKLNP